MKKSLFISWSGPTSEAVATALRLWLPNIFQHLEPFMSRADIGKGLRWHQEISSRLEEADIGIVCLTPDNLQEPWILFEAGALAKKVKEGRVCTFLWQVRETDVPAPLSLFQHTKVDSKDDTKALVRTINKSLGEFALSHEQLDQIFEWAWPTFSTQLQTIPALVKDVSPIHRGSDSEVLDQIFLTVKDIARQGIVAAYDVRSGSANSSSDDLLSPNDAMRPSKNVLGDQKPRLKQQVHKDTSNKKIVVPRVKNRIGKRKRNK